MQIVRLVLVFLSFAVILFWLFQLGGATFLAPVTPFFESIKGITHFFYNRTTVVAGVDVDFSFLIATIFMMTMVLVLKFVVEYVEMCERKYDKIYMYFKKKAEDLFNIGLEKQHLMSEYKNNKFMLLVSFEVKNLAKDSFFDKDSGVGEVEKQKEVLIAFLNSFDVGIGYQKKLIELGQVDGQNSSQNGSILLSFNDINEVDKVISCIEENIVRLKRKYIAEKWQIASLIGIEVYAEEKEVMLKILNLKKLIKLKLYDKILCLGNFKQRYLLQNKPKYMAEGKGIYTINDKEEEVFCIEKIK